MNLKTSLFLLSIILSSCFLRAQSGYAYYQKKLFSNNSEVTDPYMRKAINQLKAQEYKLSFTENLALFEKVEEMGIETNPVVKAYIESISRFNGEIYFDRINEKIILKKEFAGKSFLIHKKKIDWALTKGSLKIDNFLCYKATTTLSLKSSEGSHKLKVVAWYAPEISMPYGPDGFGGLPGLILRLENNGIVTTIKNIKFLEDDKSIEISLPTTGKSITEEDFDDLVAKAFANRKK